MLFDATENPLYEAKQMFLVGNYDKAILEANNAISSSKPTSGPGIAFATEKTALLVFSQLGLGNFSAALQLLNNKTDIHLSTLRKLVEFKSALHTHPQALVRPNITEDGSIVEEVALPVEIQTALDALLTITEQENVMTLDSIYKTKYVMIALIDVHRYKDALQYGYRHLNATEKLIAEGANKNVSYDNMIRILELHALIIEALLRINCIDEAATQLERMSAVNESIILTRLYVGIVQLHHAQRNASHEMFHEALKSLQRVLSESGPSPLILNLIAIAQLGCGDDVAAAEASLLQALDLRSNDGNTLANLASTSVHLNKGNEFTEQFLSQASHMSTVWSAEFLNMQHKLEAAMSKFTK